MKSSIECIRMRAVFLGFFLREDAGNSQHHWPGKGSHKKKKDLNGEEELNYTRRRIGLVLLGWVLAFSERMLGIPRTLQTRTSRPKRKRRRPAAKVSQPDGRWAGGHYSRRCWLLRRDRCAILHRRWLLPLLAAAAAILRRNRTVKLLITSRKGDSNWLRGCVEIRRRARCPKEPTRKKKTSKRKKTTSILTTRSFSPFLPHHASLILCRIYRIFLLWYGFLRL